jgi:hypothetical protein
MGHKSLETTMGYLHAEVLSVRSPASLVQDYRRSAEDSVGTDHK